MQWWYDVCLPGSCGTRTQLKSGGFTAERRTEERRWTETADDVASADKANQPSSFPAHKEDVQLSDFGTDKPISQ